jgi:ATP-grasp domain
VSSVTSEVLFLDTNRAENGIAAMEVAQALGYVAHFVTSDLAEYDWLSRDPAAVADEVSVLATSDIGRLLHFASGRTPATVLAFDDDRVIHAAVMRDFLGIPFGPSYSALVGVRFKDLLRQQLSGSPCSLESQRVPVEAQELPTWRSYPCILKPADQSGGLGARVCDGLDDLVAGLRYLQGRRRDASLSVGRPDVAVIEEFIEGPQFSAEMSWHHSSRSWCVLGFTKAHTVSRPHPLTVASIYPHRFDPAVEQSVTHQLREILATMGLDQTVIHLEFRLSADAVKVLDVNPRPAGGRIRQLMQEVHGADVLSHAYLASHLGRDAPPMADSGDVAGVWFAVPGKPGWVQDVDLPPIRDPRIVDAGRLGPFPVEVPPEMNADYLLAYAMAVAPSVAEVEDCLREYIGQVRMVEVRAAQTAG